MQVYVFMENKNTKEELIESMVFLKYFGDLKKYIKKKKLIDNSTPQFSLKLDYQEPLPEEFAQSIGMGKGWRGVTFEGKRIGYWKGAAIFDDDVFTMRETRCDKMGYRSNIPLVVPEWVSREEVFRGVFNIIVPKDLDSRKMGFYEITFVINEDDYWDRHVCICEANSAQMAINVFDSWISTKLPQGQNVVPEETTVKRIKHYDHGIVYHDVREWDEGGDSM